MAQEACPFATLAWSVLAATEPGSQAPSLVAVTRALMERERVFACLIDGRRFDCGTKLVYLEAQFAFAQKRSDLWNGLQQRLAELLVHEDGSHDRATNAALTGAATGSQLPTPGS